MNSLEIANRKSQNNNSMKEPCQHDPEEIQVHAYGGTPPKPESLKYFAKPIAEQMFSVFQKMDEKAQKNFFGAEEPVPSEE